MHKIIIQDRTTNGYEKLVRDSIERVTSVLQEDELQGLFEVLLLDECAREGHKKTGGFYYSQTDNRSAYIELYPPVIIKAIPKFLPKLRPFKKYAIIRMFLHELGHHHCGGEDPQSREVKANQYMEFRIKAIYGRWAGFFEFLGNMNMILFE